MTDKLSKQRIDIKTQYTDFNKLQTSNLISSKNNEEYKLVLKGSEFFYVSSKLLIEHFGFFRKRNSLLGTDNKVSEFHFSVISGTALQNLLDFTKTSN